MFPEFKKVRRNLPNYERAKLALRLEPIIKEKAKERQLSTLKQNLTGVQKSAPQKKVKLAERFRRNLQKRIGQLKPEKKIKNFLKVEAKNVSRIQKTLTTQLKHVKNLEELHAKHLI